MNNAIEQKFVNKSLRGSAWRRMSVVLLLLALLIVGSSVVACSTSTTSTSTSTPTSQNSGSTVTPTQAASSAAQQLYTQVTSKQPDVSDALTGSSNFMGQNPPNCTFSVGAFHVKDTQPNYYIWCISKATTLSNFALQTDMTIVSGDTGGVMFRIDSTVAQYYRFEIGQDGTYSLHLSTSATGTEQLLLSGSSSAITTGIGQKNTLAVLASGGSLSFFVNKQFVANKSDTTLTSGNIGFIADSKANAPTDVSFNNVQIWNM